MSRSILDYISLILIGIYNSILFIGSTIMIIFGLILLTSDVTTKNGWSSFVKIIGIILLIIGIIIIPCYCCGYKALTSANNRNTLKVAKIFLMLNMITMTAWSIFFISDLIKDNDNSRNNGSIVILIICIASILSSISLISRNFGFNRRERFQERDIEMNVVAEPGTIIEGEYYI